MRTFFLTLTLVLVGTLTGCDSPQRTLDTARRQLTEFKADPTAAKQAAVEASLQKLDQQIADMEAKGESTSELQRQAVSLRSDYQAARMARALLDAKNAIEGFGNAIQEAGKSFAETLSSGNTNRAESQP